MGNVLTPKEVEEQSKQVFGQFGKKWKKWAKYNAKLPLINSEKLRNVGLGKFLVSAAMGESLEENIEIMKAYRDRFDLITCDKGFGILLEHGLKPDFVMICDSNIPFKWLEKYIDQTKDIALLMTPYANIKWTHRWRGPKYKFVSKDAIETEKIFLEILGQDTRIIPAGSNVSNAMITFWLNFFGQKVDNFGGYEAYFLVGYDYGWRPNGNYYAFSNPKPKRYYLNHRTLLDMNKDMFFTSENLLFSAKWLFSYITTFNLPMVNCSQRGLLAIPRCGSLKNQLMKINPNKDIIKNIRIKYKQLLKVKKEFEMINQEFNQAREALVL